MDDATMLSWIERGRTLSYLLVAVGVVGEFLVDRISGPIIKRRDDTQKAEIARLNKEAGEARKSAGEAMERAAHLEKQAEDERIARLKIEERISPRQINPKHLPSIVAKLAAFKGHRADIGAVPETFEGASLARQIQVILADSHWSADIMQAEAAGPLGGIARGVMVRYTSDPRSLAAARALVEVLEAEQIAAFIVPGLPGPFQNSRQDDPAIFRVLIVVGNNP